MNKEFYIEKRNGMGELLDLDKISMALYKANISIVKGRITSEQLRDSSEEIYHHTVTFLRDSGRTKITMTEFEKILLDTITKYPYLKNSYCTYNKSREQSRLVTSQVFQSIGRIAEETDRDNANVGNNFSSKLLRISSESNKFYNMAMIDKETSRNHDIGRVYQHDLDSYNLTINCTHIDSKKLLTKGFNTGYGTLNPSKRIESAAPLMCIIIQSSQNDMYGGQSFPNFDTDLAPFLRKTLMEQCVQHVEYLTGWEESEEYVNKVALEYFNNIRENRYKSGNKEFKQIIFKTITALKSAMSTVVYNLNTMHSRAGSQVPFSSLNIGLPIDIEGELICEHFLLQYEKGLGKGEQPIFPNIIFRVKKGVNRESGDPYYYLYKLACKVAAKRMNPTFMNMDSSFNLPHYEKGNFPATMGCRTYIMDNINGKSIVEGRGNAASSTINLPRMALEVLGENPDTDKEILKDKFRIKLQEFLRFSEKALMDRYEKLKTIKVKDLPFSAGEGLLMGSEGLDKNDSIEPILKHSSWAIGFIGLAETLTLLTGKHHGECEESKDFGLEIVTSIREFTDNAKQKHRLNFSCYATPAEGLSGYFIAKDREIFGDILGITDKGFYTNSFHLPVNFEVSFKNKIDIEAPYHALCNGGHISYIEVDGTPDGDVIETIVTNAYKTSDISYIGVNFHIKYCRNCGHYLETETLNICNECGSNDIQGISRVTGYLGLDERFGSGKSNERNNRTAHADLHGKENEESIGKRTYNIKEK